MTATTIDEVISQLNVIIENSKVKESRQGYFTALYRRVTIAVKEGIAAGRFQDGPRMECLDVIFANRYLNAYTQYLAGKPPTESWRFAFVQARRWHPMILQHLLLGMNAHINLDLGIAAAQTCPDGALPGLEHDFKEINTVLSELVDEMQQRIGSVSPWLAWAGRIGNKADDAIVNFSMQNARDAAWAFAQKLAALGQEAQSAAIASRDFEVTRFSKVVSTPGPLGSSLALFIRLRESSDIPKVIDALS